MMYSIGSRNGTQAVPYDFEFGAPSISINGARLHRRGRSGDRPLRFARVAVLFIRTLGTVHRPFPSIDSRNVMIL